MTMWLNENVRDKIKRTQKLNNLLQLWFMFIVKSLDLILAQNFLLA